MMAELTLTACYGRDIEALADLAGDFDALSTSQVDAFGLKQWSQVAEVLGFSRELAAAVAPIRSRRRGMPGLHAAGLAAFDTWSARRPYPGSLTGVARVARARVRHEALLALAGSARPSLWSVEVAAGALPGGACFESAPGESSRAFLVDAAENYFHAARPGAMQERSVCGWDTPVILSLGTYPWIYGGRLEVDPPGLAWDASTPWNPASLAMHVMTNFWEPMGNLQQDARDVVRQYRRFRVAADAALAAVPARGGPGALVRRGQLLHVEHGSLAYAGVRSPLGYLSAAAHNHIVQRHAAFFAARRAYLRIVRHIPPELQRAVAGNPDPCLSPLVNHARTVGVRA